MAVRFTVFRLASLACALLLAGSAAAQAQTANPPAKPAKKPVASASSKNAAAKAKAEKEAAEKAAAEAAAAEAAAAEAAAAAAAEAEAEKAAAIKGYLAYRWKDVGALKYKVTTVEETQVTRGGSPSTISKDKQTELTLKPVGKDTEKPHLTWVELHFDRLVLKAMPQGIELDSDAAENPKAGPLAPAAAVYRAVKAKPIRVLMSPGGRLLKFEGVDEFAAAARGAMPESPQRDAILAEILPVTPAEISNQFASALLALPGKSVDPGHSEPRKLPVPGTAHSMEGTLTFTGKEEQDGRQVAVIKQVLAAHGLPPTAVPAQKISLTIDDYGVDTDLRLALDKGIPLQLTATTTTKQSVRPENADPSSAPTILIQSTSRTTTSLVSAEPAAAPPAEGEAAAATAVTPPQAPEVPAAVQAPPPPPPPPPPQG